MVPSNKEERSGCGSRLQQWCRSRNCQLWRLLLLPFIPILALIVQTTLSLENSITNGRDVADVEEQVSRATELGKLVTRLQQERSEVAFFIFTNGSTLRSNLTQRFAGTDSAILQMGDLPTLMFKNRMSPVSGIQFQAELSELRSSINDGTSMTEAMEWYNNANAALLNHLTKQIKDTDSSTIWRYLVGFKNLLRSIECKGIASVLGINYFARGYLQPKAYERFIAHMVLGRDLLDNTLNLVPSLIPLHKDIKEDSSEYQVLEKKNQQIVDNKHQDGSVPDAIDYFDQTATFLDKLRAVQKQLRENIRDRVNESLTEARRSEVVCAGILVLVCVVSPIIIALVRNAVNTIQVYARNLSEKARELEYEKELSDSLLYQMLPASVAKQLKQTQQNSAEMATAQVTCERQITSRVDGVLPVSECYSSLPEMEHCNKLDMSSYYTSPIFSDAEVPDKKLPTEQQLNLITACNLEEPSMYTSADRETQNTQQQYTADSDAEIITQSWAVKYKKLPPNQQVLVDKNIIDILFAGAVGKLKRDYNNFTSSTKHGTTAHLTSTSVYNTNETYELLCLNNNNYNQLESESDSDAFRKYWLVKYCRLSEDQRLLADKLINEVIFEALGTLRQNVEGSATLMPFPEDKIESTIPQDSTNSSMLPQLPYTYEFNVIEYNDLNDPVTEIQLNQLENSDLLLSDYNMDTGAHVYQ